MVNISIVNDWTGHLPCWVSKNGKNGCVLFNDISKILYLSSFGLFFSFLFPPLSFYFSLFCMSQNAYDTFKKRYYDFTDQGNTQTMSKEQNDEV